MAWNILLTLWIVALCACSIGFHNYVWFLSIGYGLSVAAVSAAVLIIFHSSLSVINVFQCAVLIFYGLRLGVFLAMREWKNASYRKTLKEASKTEKKIPFFVLIIMWIAVAALYVMQVSPLMYRLYNGSTDIICPLIGACISLEGAIIEAVADYQKSVQKKENPQMVATKGLYKYVRCPNYYGELLVWLGVLIGGITTYHAGQLVMALIAFACITYIMIDGAKRLEVRQNKRLKGNPEYEHYVNTTPILIPQIPVYHLVKEDKS